MMLYELIFIFFSAVSIYNLQHTPQKFFLVFIMAVNDNAVSYKLFYYYCNIIKASKDNGIPFKDYELKYIKKEWFICLDNMVNSIISNPDMEEYLKDSLEQWNNLVLDKEDIKNKYNFIRAIFFDEDIKIIEITDIIDDNKEYEPFGKVLEMLCGHHIPREQYVIGDYESGDIKEYNCPEFYIPSTPNAIYKCYKQVYNDLPENTQDQDKLNHVNMIKYLEANKCDLKKDPRWYKVVSKGGKNYYTPRDVRDKASMNCIILIQVQKEPALYHPVLVRGSTPILAPLDKIYDNFHVYLYPEHQESRNNMSDHDLGVLLMTKHIRQNNPIAFDTIPNTLVEFDYMIQIRLNKEIFMKYSTKEKEEDKIKQYEYRNMCMIEEWKNWSMEWPPKEDMIKKYQQFRSNYKLFAIRSNERFKQSVLNTMREKQLNSVKELIY